MTKLRKLMAGNAATDFQESFLSGLRGLLDGIIKAVTSLRTSLVERGAAASCRRSPRHMVLAWILWWSC